MAIQKIGDEIMDMFFPPAKGNDAVVDAPTTSSEVGGWSIRHAVSATGIDENKLIELINEKPNVETINKFGRFDRLLETVDKGKAKEFFEEKAGAKLTEFRLNVAIYNFVKNLVLTQPVANVDTDVPSPAYGQRINAEDAFNVLTETNPTLFKYTFNKTAQLAAGEYFISSGDEDKRYTLRQKTSGGSIYVCVLGNNPVSALKKALGYANKAPLYFDPSHKLGEFEVNLVAEGPSSGQGDTEITRDMIDSAVFVGGKYEGLRPDEVATQHQEVSYLTWLVSNNKTEGFEKALLLAINEAISLYSPYRTIPEGVDMGAVYAELNEVGVTVNTVPAEINGDKFTMGEIKGLPFNFAGTPTYKIVREIFSQRVDFNKEKSQWVAYGLTDGLELTRDRIAYSLMIGLMNANAERMRKLHIESNKPSSRLEDYAASALVSDATQAIINTGLEFGIPKKVLDDQVADIGHIINAHKEDKGLFLLANEAGTGKTMVLGGTINELRKSGDETPVLYLTINQDLIEQIKNDLKDYDISGTHFMTYAGLSGNETLPDEFQHRNYILIADETQNLKNTASSRGDRGQGIMRGASFSILASATPFDDPSQASYIDATSVFERAGFKGGYKEWGYMYGVNVEKFRNNTSYSWDGTERDGVMAREWFMKNGLMTFREMSLPAKQVESVFRSYDVSDKWVKLFNKVEAAYAMAAGGDENPSLINMHRENTLRRILEASKIEIAIDSAQKAIAAGMYPIIFVDTKSERHLSSFRTMGSKPNSPLYDFPQMREMMAEWEAEKRIAMNIGADYPPPPFSTAIYRIAEAMHLTGVDEILPATGEEIIAGFDKDGVAIYQGSISPAKASKNLAEWREGKRKVLVATVAKGGTGLSLHDKVGNHQTCQIVTNLPWTAREVDQVGGRSARYGLVGVAHMEWIFANNIPFEKDLVQTVSKRMLALGASVKGFNQDAVRALSAGESFTELKVRGEGVYQAEQTDIALPFNDILSAEAWMQTQITNFGSEKLFYASQGYAKYKTALDAVLGETGPSLESEITDVAKIAVPGVAPVQTEIVTKPITASVDIDVPSPVLKHANNGAEQTVQDEVSRIAKTYAETLQAQTGNPIKSDSEMVLGFARAVIDKNPYPLQYLANGLNETGKTVFSQITGIALPRAQGKTWEALLEWGGISPQAEALRVAKNTAEKARSKAEKTFGNTEEISAELRELFARGFTQLNMVGREAWMLNDAGEGYRMNHKGVEWKELKPLMEAELKLFLLEKEIGVAADVNDVPGEKPVTTQDFTAEVNALMALISSEQNVWGAMELAGYLGGRPLLTAFKDTIYLHEDANIRGKVIDSFLMTDETLKSPRRYRMKQDEGAPSDDVANTSGWQSFHPIAGLYRNDSGNPNYSVGEGVVEFVRSGADERLLGLEQEVVAAIIHDKMEQLDYEKAYELILEGIASQPGISPIVQKGIEKLAVEINQGFAEFVAQKHAQLSQKTQSDLEAGPQGAEPLADEKQPSEENIANSDIQFIEENLIAALQNIDKDRIAALNALKEKVDGLLAGVTQENAAQVIAMSRDLYGELHAAMKMEPASIASELLAHPLMQAASEIQENAKTAKNRFDAEEQRLNGMRKSASKEAALQSNNDSMNQAWEGLRSRIEGNKDLSAIFESAASSLSSLAIFNTQNNVLAYLQKKYIAEGKLENAKLLSKEISEKIRELDEAAINHRAELFKRQAAEEGAAITADNVLSVYNLDHNPAADAIQQDDIFNRFDPYTATWEEVLALGVEPIDGFGRNKDTQSITITGSYFKDKNGDMRTMPEFKISSRGKRSFELGKIPEVVEFNGYKETLRNMTIEQRQFFSAIEAVRVKDGHPRLDLIMANAIVKSMSGTPTSYGYYNWAPYVLDVMGVEITTKMDINDIVNLMQDEVGRIKSTSISTPEIQVKKAEPKPAWDMLRDAWVEQEMENNEYAEAYRENPEAGKAKRNDYQTEWVEKVIAQSAKERIRDDVLNEFVRIYGAEVFSRTFRGVNEVGVAGYLLPEPVAKAEPVKAQPGVLEGPRRKLDQVNYFNPFMHGDITTIGSREWQVKSDTAGWYLTSDGTWRGKHPGIGDIRGMNDFIAAVVKESANATQELAARAALKAGVDITPEKIEVVPVVALESVSDEMEGEFKGIDLLDDFDSMPDDIKEVMLSLGDDIDYAAVAKAEAKAVALGYAFDWGLDGVPHNLRRTVTPQPNVRIVPLNEQGDLFASVSNDYTHSESEYSAPTLLTIPTEEQAIETNIADYGDYVYGAAKDLRSKTISAYNGELPSDLLDIKSLTSADILPTLNYPSLKGNGLSHETLALVALIRSESPRKPATNIRRWFDECKRNRDVIAHLLEFDSGKDFESILASTGMATHKYKLLLQVPVEHLQIVSNSFKVYHHSTDKGKEYSLLYNKRFQKSRHSDLNEFAVMAAKEAVAIIQAKNEKIASGNNKDGDSVPKSVSVYSRRSTGELFIGFKGQGGVVELLMMPAGSKTRDAWIYLKENGKEINAILEEKRTAAMAFRRQHDNAREGIISYRNDNENITPEKLANTFGLSSVQFGNSTLASKKEAQAKINAAYDAFKDLALVLGIPDRAIGLSGSLSMAFGSRGKGGLSKAGLRVAAHYEPTNIIINLTREAGAGTLAHEWLHAFDNYAAKVMSDPEINAGKALIYYGTNEAVKGKPGWSSGEFVAREEFISGFKAIHQAINNNSFSYAAEELDGLFTSGKYFSQNIERAARAFEKYVSVKLREREISNDFLVNITSLNNTVGVSGGIPTDEQMEGLGITEAFDQLFTTLKHRETEKGVALYRVADRFDAVMNVWASVCNEDDIFQYETPTSKSIEVLFNNAGMEIVRDGALLEDEQSNPGNHDYYVADVWRITTDKERTVFVFETDNVVWLDVSDIGEYAEDSMGKTVTVGGTGRGTQLYQLVASYAHNTGKVFVGDPAGLSETAIVRRTENMLSSALRYGTTSHLAPGLNQIEGTNKEGRLALVAQLSWSDNDQQNMLSLLKASYNNVVNHIPELLDVEFDFERSEFRVSGSVAGPRSVASNIVQYLNAKPTEARSLWMEPENVLGRKLSPMAGALAGSATLKRAAVTQALLRITGQENERSRLLEHVQELFAAAAQSDSLAGILYSQDMAPVSAVSHPEQIKAWIKETEVYTGVEVRVVPAATDLPYYLQSGVGPATRGVYDVKTKQSYLIADRNPTRAIAIKTALHEGLGHCGVISFMERNAQAGGASFNAMLDDIYASIGDKEIASKVSAYELNLHTLSGRREAVLEYIALTAEKGGARDDMVEVANSTREVLDNLYDDVRWSQDDILSLIEASRNYMARTQLASEAKKEAIFAEVLEQAGGRLAELLKRKQAPFKDRMTMDLDMSREGRLGRARAMGFNTDITYLHGTGAEFTAFRDAGPHYFTTNPNYSYIKNSGVNYPVFLKMESPFVTDNQGFVEGLRSRPDVIAELQAQGYDSVMYATPGNPYKGPLGWGDDYPQVAVFSGDQVRSVHGAFIEQGKVRDILQALDAEPKRSLADTLVKDDWGNPKIVYRGEWGVPEGYQSKIQTKIPTITFASFKTARIYASGKQGDNRVMAAFLDIRNPFINNPDDPFIDISHITSKLGTDLDDAVRLARKFELALHNTNGMWEVIDKYKVETLDELLLLHPQAAYELYIDSYHFFDDQEEVVRVRAMGYDGAIHCGNGSSSDEPEYKVFSESQILPVSDYPEFAYNKPLIEELAKNDLVLASNPTAFQWDKNNMFSVRNLAASVMMAMSISGSVTAAGMPQYYRDAGVPLSAINIEMVDGRAGAQAATHLGEALKGLNVDVVRVSETLFKQRGVANNLISESGPDVEWCITDNGEAYTSISENAKASELAGVRLMFLGINATEAKHGALAEAIKLKGQKVHQSDILEETGWHQGADNRWRFEIADDTAQLKHGLLDVIKREVGQGHTLSVQLKDVLTHDTLYRNYPQLQTYSVTFAAPRLNSSVMAHVSGTDITLYIDDLRTEEEVEGWLLHEIQHTVQRIELLAVGGSSSKSGQNNTVNRLSERNSLLMDYEAERKMEGIRHDLGRYRAMQQYEYMVNLAHNDGITRQAKAIYTSHELNTNRRKYYEEVGYPPSKRNVGQHRDWLQSVAMHIASDTAQRYKEKYSINIRDAIEGAKDKDGVNAIKNNLARLSRAWDKVAPRTRNNAALESDMARALQSDRYELYYGLAGEVEARNTESRRWLNNEQRKLKHPQSTEDVPRSGQTVIYEDAKASIAAANQETVVGISALESGESLLNKVTRKAMAIAERMGIAEKVNVHASQTDMPAQVQEYAETVSAKSVPAAIFKGTVHLAADQLHTDAQIESALLHESAHIGSQTLFGRDMAKPYGRFWVAIGKESGLISEAKKAGVEMDHYVTAANHLFDAGKISLHQRTELLVDEFLAHVNQAKCNEKTGEKCQRLVREMAGSAKNTLIKYGLKECGNLSLSDISYTLKCVNDAVRKEVNVPIILTADTRSSMDRSLWNIQVRENMAMLGMPIVEAYKIQQKGTQAEECWNLEVSPAVAAVVMSGLPATLVASKLVDVLAKGQDGTVVRSVDEEGYQMAVANLSDIAEANKDVSMSVLISEIIKAETNLAGILGKIDQAGPRILVEVKEIPMDKPKKLADKDKPHDFGPSM